MWLRAVFFPRKTVCHFAGPDAARISQLVELNGVRRTWYIGTFIYPRGPGMIELR